MGHTIKQVLSKEQNVLFCTFLNNYIMEFPFFVLYRFFVAYKSYNLETTLSIVVIYELDL